MYSVSCVLCTGGRSSTSGGLIHDQKKPAFPKDQFDCTVQIVLSEYMLAEGVVHRVLTISVNSNAKY